MSSISIKIDDKDFQKWIKGMPAQVDRAIERAIRKAALLIERYGKLNAPVDTGRLRSSIYTNIRPTTATVSTNVNYAIFVHDGTRNMTGQPFMADAEKQVSSELQSILEQEAEAMLK